MAKSGGGAANAGGVDFQSRFAAWIAVHILAEKDTALPWELPAGTTLNWLECETDQPVDDLSVGTSTNGRIVSQAKRSVRLSEMRSSDFASSLDEFVRQFVAGLTNTTGENPDARRLDPSRDRLVLLTSSNSSGTIRTDLPAVLRRVRTLRADQSLENAAVNKGERRALSIMKAHITSSWQSALGIGPSDEEIRQLLSLVHIQTLDVEDETDGEREAKTLLRMAVLQDPDQADTAWARLISLCTGLAATRTGVDRSRLQAELLKVGIQLKIPRSYQNDVERLDRYSAVTLDALAHHAQIRLHQTTIKIQRQSVEALKKAAEENSILVIGEPGAGKSGAIFDLAQRFGDDGLDIVVLAVDRIAAGSLAQLRIEMGLDHELIEVLDNWPGVQPAFLIIDALDAARGDSAGAMTRDLIRIIVERGGRWHVVASIRKFDLRYDGEIRKIFAGDPPTEFQDVEFGSVRHVSIPRLGEDDLSQLVSQAPELDVLITGAPAQLRDLLLNLFNLNLMVELIGTGLDIRELTPITTQFELLECYWSERVIRVDGQGDAREALLQKTCRKMVDARALRIERLDVVDASSSTFLDDLLSSQVLIEWQSSPNAVPERYILAFSHNVIFDYAVARLILRSTPDAFVKRLVNDPELPVAARPSLVLHFRYVWTVDKSRLQFWGLVFAVIATDGVPEIGKLIGPSLAAELARELPDLEPLSKAIDDFNSEIYSTADRALRHLLGALLAGVPDEVLLVGLDTSPWCQLLERVSRALRSTNAYTIRPTLSIICEHPEKLTLDQQSAVGKTARRLLEFAWSQTVVDNWLAINALQCVCRTLESDRPSSVELIRRCFEPAHLIEYGYEEMPKLAQEVNRLILIEPGLVEEIYRVVFQYQESSDDVTSLGGSSILSLTSTRRQDYGLALHELAEAFPRFLAHSPENATRVLIDVMEAYVLQRHAPRPGEVHAQTFEFDGVPARIRADFSAIWDEGDAYRIDEPLKMLDTFQRYLEGLAGSVTELEKLHKLIQVIVTKSPLAVLWRRLLLAGARFPTTLGLKIQSLAWATPILIGYDTNRPAGEFIKAIFAALDDGARQRIEKAILSIPDVATPDTHESAERLRDRLLGCLVGQSIVTTEAQSLLDELSRRDSIPSNDPPWRFEAESHSYTEEDYLKGQGVPIEAAPNRKILELEGPAKAFVDKYLNLIPNLADASDVLVSLEKLYEALSRADFDGVHPVLRDDAWRYLTAACVRLANVNPLTCDSPIGMLVKTVLLEASGHSDPVHDPVDDAKFEESPSWNGGVPRVKAAEGLTILARNLTCSTSEVLEALERLSQDPVPAVRFQVANLLNLVYQTAPDFMWSIFERICKEEVNRGVLHGLLGGPFQRLAAIEQDKIAELTSIIFGRVKDGSGAKGVREICIGIFANLYIWRNNAQVSGFIGDIATSPTSYPEDVSYIAAHLRKPLTVGPIQPPDHEQDAVRHRAVNLLDRILRSASDGFRDIQQSHFNVPFADWSPDDQEHTKSLARLIDHLGKEIYFASGAYSGQGQNEPLEDQMQQRARAERFYRETGSILDKLTDVGIPGIVHYHLQTLEYFIPINPRDVFLRIGRVVRAGQRGGYQYDPMAADLIVRLVERYLAEYRALLGSDDGCRRTLIDVLDVFVDVGWPSVRRLSYRLDEIFR